MEDVNKPTCYLTFNVFPRTAPYDVTARLLPVFLLFALSLAACNDGADDTSWTVDHGALDLRQTLYLTDGPDYYFGHIFDVAVRQDGRIYVADGRAGHVKMLSEDGALLDTIGTRGQGPGEFQRGPTQVTLARGDSLYAVDAYSKQVSVFGPDHAFVRSFFITGDTGRLLRLHVPKDSSQYRVVTSSFPVAGTPGRERIVRTDALGAVTDTLLATPPKNVVVKQRGGRTVWAGVPFARSAQTATGPDQTLYYAWGDSLATFAVEADGERREAVRIPFDSVPVTTAEIRRAMDAGNRRQVAPDEVRERIPDTKPAFERYLVDDTGRHWFGRATASPDSIDWWMANPKEKTVVTATLPSRVYLMTVRGGSAYGLKMTESGAPALVRYRVEVKDGDENE